MQEDYFTISEKFTYELTEKKSNFIGICVPIKDDREASEFIEKVRHKYPDARHNVYAYSVNVNGVLAERYSDDGEPKGTAGVPLLEAIHKSGLSNVLVTVTRYFGGILLGAAGLTRAYSNTASSALNGAKRIRMKFSNQYEIIIRYDLYGKISKYLETIRCIQKAPDFGETVKLNVTIPASEEESFMKNMNEITSGDFVCKLLVKGFYNIDG